MKNQEQIVEQNQQTDNTRQDVASSVDQIEPFETVKILSTHNNKEFYTLLMNQFREMNGNPQQKIKILINRLQKFFSRDSRAKMDMIDSYFCPKRQPFYKIGNRQIQILNNEVILFGIDFLGTKTINMSFKPDIELVQIDMSHVKLVFLDFNSAMASLKKNQRQGVEQNIIKLQNSAPPKGNFLFYQLSGWMEMRPYYFGNFQRRVLARFATFEQKDLRKSNKIASNIPQYALKVFELKKKQHQEIQKNYILRQQRLRQQKYERGFKKQQGSSRYNHNDNSDKTSQKSYNTLRIGAGYHRSKFDQQQQQNPVRQRSRQKDFDAQSVTSKRSLNSLIGRFDRKMYLNQQEDDMNKTIQMNESWRKHADPQNNKKNDDLSISYNNGYRRDLQYKNEDHDQSISLNNGYKSNWNQANKKDESSHDQSIQLNTSYKRSNFQLAEKENENDVSFNNGYDSKKRPFDESSSMVSDAQFLLQRNQDIFRDMAERLGLCSLREQQQNSLNDINKNNKQIQLQNNNQVSFNDSSPNIYRNLNYSLNTSSHNASISLNSYRLSQNMPDRRKGAQQQANTQAWDYKKYIQESQKRQQAENQLKRVYIVLDD